MLRKLMGAFTVLILIGVLLTGLFSMEIAKTYYFKSVEEKLISIGKLLQQDINDKLSVGSDLDFRELAVKYGSKTAERITMVDIDGSVMGDSEADPDEMGDHSQRPEIRQAYKEGLGISIRTSSTLKKEMLYIALPLHDGNRTTGAVRVGLPLNDIDVIQNRIWRYIFFAIFTGITVALVLGYRYLSMITKSIREMTDMARTIAGGTFHKRVEVKNDDEIGKLARSFNYMAEKLSSTIKELIDGKSKTEAMLTSSKNGVIAVDNSECIMLINPVAEEYFGIGRNHSEGIPLSEIIEDHEVYQLLKGVISSSHEEPVEFELSRPQYRVFRVFSSPIRPKVRHSRIIGTLLIVQDVTKIRKLEKVRSDFVANVTHELRTPLTSIRGFIETLKEGAIEDKNTRVRFLDIISLEAERLERLIDDILTLSEIENKASQLPVNDIDVVRVIEEEILSIMNKQAREKDIIIETDFGKGLPILKMNKDRFKEMLINLIDNAVKYNREGGRVLLSACRSESNMVLKVKDSGIGIPLEYQERLFERFYRVDRGRSRKGGGTGLGLAIVKHIVLSANGSIDVSSRPGEGTEFKIELPLDGGE